MVVCFVDIGGIVYHHCLNFLFILSNCNLFSISQKDGGCMSGIRFVFIIQNKYLKPYHHKPHKDQTWSQS